MCDNTRFHVARHQEILGSYTSLEIRQMIAKGYLQPSDMAYIESTRSWQSLIPPLPCKRWTPADQEDPPLFYIANNRVYGPRCFDEMAALYIAGHITRQTLWCSVGMDEWNEFGPIADDIDQEANSIDHLNKAKEELYQGNFIQAAIQFGNHLLNSVPDRLEEESESNQQPNLALPPLASKPIL